MSKFVFIFLVGLVSFSAFSVEGTLAEEEVGRSPYESPLNAALDLQYTPTTLNQYEYLPGSTSSKTGRSARLGFEWLPFEDAPWGKWAVGVGTGALHVESNDIGQGLSGSILAFPIQVSMSYRLDYFKNQFVVPFFRAGFTALWMKQTTEFPDGGKGYYHAWGYTGDWAVGGEICLNVIDKKSSRDFDSAIGVNNTYLVFEYGKNRSMTGTTQPDFSREEYRVGLRFEM